MNEKTFVEKWSSFYNPYGEILVVSKLGKAYYCNEYKLTNLDGRKAVVLFYEGEYLGIIHIRDIECVVPVKDN